MVDSDNVILSGALLCMLMVFTLPMGISSLIIGYNGSEECFTDYDGISFEYDEWLFITGFIDIFTFLILAIIAASMACDAEALMFCMGVFYVIFALFSFCWSIVGAVLFFNTVDNEGCHGTQIYSFGLARFIIWIVASVCTLTSRSKE